MKSRLREFADAVKRSNEQVSVSPQAKTVAEFFAGIGLMRMGLEQAGWRTVYANDIDPKKHQMYLRQFRDAEEVLDRRDIYDVLPGQLPAVGLATASFPCTDLSLAGARRGLAGTHSSTFWGFAKLIENMAPRPPLLLLENVPGLLTSHKGGDLTTILRDLNRLGYVVDIFTVDAIHFVPQSRRRLFVVATQSERPVDTRAPLLLADSARPPDVVHFIANSHDVQWGVRPLPALPESGRHLTDVLDDLPDDDPLWWVQERVDYLRNQMSERHRAVVDEAVAAPNITWLTAFRRVRNGISMAEVRNDGVAGCLRTPRGGSGRQILLRAGGGNLSARLLSGRECARLMGADAYELDVPLNQALFGFGDAVCVPAVTWIARNYLNPALAELACGAPPPSPGDTAEVCAA